MAYLFTDGKFQAFDNSGAPLALGKVYTYAAGGLTPLDTYTTQAGGTTNANPVILDSSGRANIWLGNSSYRIILKTSADVTIWDTDNIKLSIPVATTQDFTATEGQTVFNLATAATSASVYVNGVKLVAGDYTLTTSTQLTLDVGVEEYDEVSIVGMSA